MDAASYDRAFDASPTPIIKRFCTLPNRVTSYEEAQRLAHEDIAQLGTAALRHELDVLKWWSPLRRPGHPWFRERIRRLEGELRGRH